ncbi:MAG: class I SAM-dependent methyltransferase [Solirubrobacteraceae bacterium]
MLGWRTDRVVALTPLNTAALASPSLVYGRAPASMFLGFVGSLHGTVLDIGPGEGGSAEPLRAAGAERLVGIEPDPTAAQAARARYDEVIEKPIESVGDDVIGAADVIIAADCLEHLLDPWGVLRQLHAGSPPHARLAISVPNLRYLGILVPALMWGRFEYSDVGGIMDRGHLRWFTHASMGRALTACGWSPVRWSGAFGSGRRALLNQMSGRFLGNVLSHQIYVVAVKGERT